MKNQGKIFEEDWKKSIPKEMYYQKIKDAPNMFNKQKNPNIRFTPKQPFDAFCFDGNLGKLYCWELKSTKGTSISFEGSNPIIKKHQIEELTKASEYKNIVSGFIFNFREPENRAFFLNIKGFNRFMGEVSKKSININDIIHYGGIKIECKIKQIRYKYNVGKLIKDIG